jgi:hypothetical protein
VKGSASGERINYLWKIKNNPNNHDNKNTIHQIVSVNAISNPRSDPSM